MKYPIVCIESNTSIQKAIQAIERSPYDAAFVIDENGCYLGGVGAMDLRRLLISGVESGEPVGDYPLKRVFKLTEESIKDAGESGRVISDMELYGVYFVPVVTAEGGIKDALSVEDLRTMHGLSKMMHWRKDRLVGFWLSAEPDTLGAY